MSDRRIYVNINNEQDLITLLGSEIVPEFLALGVRVEALLIGPEDDAGLRELLRRHGVPMLHVPHRRGPAAERLSRLLYKFRKLRFYARSGKDSTLYAKSALSYRGQYSPAKYLAFKAFARAFAFLLSAEPLLLALFRRAMPPLPRLDAPVLCLDYIHNEHHAELLELNRRAGFPYVAYVANLDQITNYPIHPDLPDRILTWGEFHGRILTRRFGLPAERAVPIGFCRSDSLVGLASGRKDAVRAVYFCGSMVSNDPDYETNLRLLHRALEARGTPYTLVLKQHPGKEDAIWERYLALVDGLSWKSGSIEIVRSSWEKYSKLEKNDLSGKDFSYRDLKRLLEGATHVFSSNSTTTLEAALAGARAYFINVGGKLDGIFRFEHLRVLVEGGVVPMLTTPESFDEALSRPAEGPLGDNPVVSNVGRASRVLAATCAGIYGFEAGEGKPGEAEARNPARIGSPAP